MCVRVRYALRRLWKANMGAEKIKSAFPWELQDVKEVRTVSCWGKPGEGELPKAIG